MDVYLQHLSRDKHKLEESSKQLEPCSNKRKYVLSRISSEDNDFLLNLAIQLLEYESADFESTKFARAIEKYFPAGMFKLSSTTRKSLIVGYRVIMDIFQKEAMLYTGQEKFFTKC